MIVEEDIYLEHFGVKGMHWGVRNQRRGGTPEQRRAGNRKFARNLAIGAGVGVAGGLAVAAMLKHKGLLPFSKTSPRFVASGKDFIVNSSSDTMRMDMHTMMTKVMQPMSGAETVFKAKFPDGRVTSYTRTAEEALRKAGAFNPRR